MIINKRVYNDEYGVTCDVAIIKLANELRDSLSSVVGVSVNKCIASATPFDIRFEGFYTTNNIPIKFIPTNNSSDISAGTSLSNVTHIYIWFTVKGIDYIYSMGGGPSGAHGINSFYRVDASGVVNAEMLDKSKMAYNLQLRIGTRKQDVNFFEFIISYNSDLSNFMLFVMDSGQRSSSTDPSLNTGSPIIGIGHIGTSNGKFVTFPAYRYTYEMGKYNLNTMLLSAYDGYISQLDKYRGDLYSNKTPLFAVDVFNNSKGYLDTLKNAYLINAPEVPLKNAMIININGENYIRLYMRIVDGVFFDSPTSPYKDLYMKV